jgi:hypothetical protein
MKTNANLSETEKLVVVKWKQGTSAQSRGEGKLVRI